MSGTGGAHRVGEERAERGRGVADGVQELHALRRRRRRGAEQRRLEDGQELARRRRRHRRRANPLAGRNPSGGVGGGRRNGRGTESDLKP